MRFLSRVLLALLFVGCSVGAHASIYIPKGKLAGESVYVRIGKDTASVAGIFEFEDFSVRDSKTLYFPLVGPTNTDPIKLLEQSGVDITVNGNPVGLPSPCESPVGPEVKIGGAHVYWYCVSLDEEGAGEKADGAKFTVRLNYTQALIRGRFLYLPCLPGHPREESPWRYQMLARAEHHVVRVTTEGTEYFPLIDAVSVQLKDRQIVELR